MYTPKEVAHNYLATGKAKTQYPVQKVLVLAIMAGMFIGLAGAGANVAMASVAGGSLQNFGKLLAAMVFPAGLAMVLIAGSELFTGNCLIIVPVLQKEVKLNAMFKNWVLVYIGNFIGGIIIALITVYGGTYKLFDNTAAATAIYTAVSKVSMPFWDAFLRGILCNFVVCAAVWMTFAAKDIVGKIAALFLPIMLFVLSGYEHSIANMCFIPSGLFAINNPAYVNAFEAIYHHGDIHALTWGAFFVKNLIPSTLGNIVGGAGCVGIAYWFAYIRVSDDKEAAKSAHNTKSTGNKKKKK